MLYNTVKRTFDLVSAVALALVLTFPMLFIALLVRITSKGNALYWSDRIGVGNRIFKMPKFRTMRIDTPEMATHLMSDPDRYLTPLGPLLRKLSLDELPQLWSVLRGHMSFVGPRPALYNQNDLVQLRTEKGVHRLVPGITGWAQINGRDELPIPVKVSYDEFYLRNRSFSFDVEILFMTVFKVLKKEGVQH
ncbi:MAG: Undecaprenyl phosphate N,N'-diacetylbacillosamine 1-phosphate transferase [Syntrophorhabdus sp. PtaU1.Bin153]|nr:MAG: Undecaprenyl phosphate N,N'-diacetylbacillosamine 1-phosphate transferase [Syntrophorhabdus sp. PtaU1.Bin153]